ncbi:MAG: hypothetical protein QM733_02125 [Ilumatobacteraceae bacterium]
MSHIRSIAATLAVSATAVSLAACGSSKESAATAAPTTTTAAAPTTVAAPTTAVATTAETATATVAVTTTTAAAAATTTTGAGASTGDATAADLLPSLDAVVDTATPAADVAAGIVDGADLAPTVEQLDTVIADFTITFEVVDPVTSGDTAQASVRILSNGQAFPDLYPSFWQRAGGEWKLTRAGFCTLITAGGLACPDV